MNKKILILSLITAIFITLSGCSKTTKDTSTNAPTELDTVGTTAPPENKDAQSEKGMDLKTKELSFILNNSLKASNAVKLFGEPEEKSETVILAADGLEHETWSYISKGIELDIVKDKEKQQSVFSIFINSPSTLKTSKGICIGSTKDEVMKAYKDDINAKELTADEIVVGTVYNGIVFSMENNKVAWIFIGSASE